MLFKQTVITLHQSGVSFFVKITFWWAFPWMPKIHDIFRHGRDGNGSSLTENEVVGKDDFAFAEEFDYELCFMTLQKATYMNGIFTFKESMEQKYILYLKQIMISNGGLFVSSKIIYESKVRKNSIPYQINLERNLWNL